MQRYIPDEALKNKENREKIEAILRKVPDTDLIEAGSNPLEDAIKQIRELGEEKIANLITG